LLHRVLLLLLLHHMQHVQLISDVLACTLRLQRSRTQAVATPMLADTMAPGLQHQQGKLTKHCACSCTLATRQLTEVS
jgi:hypothetical protein